MVPKVSKIEPFMCIWYPNLGREGRLRRRGETEGVGVVKKEEEEEVEKENR